MVAENTKYASESLRHELLKMIADIRRYGRMLEFWGTATIILKTEDVTECHNYRGIYNRIQDIGDSDKN